MKNAHEGKQPARRVGVDFHPVGKPRAQQLRSLVVQCTSPHVNCLNPAGARVLDRLEIAVAHQEVILDDISKNSQRKHEPRQEPIVFIANPERQSFAVDANMQNVGSGKLAQRGEVIVLDQVEKRGFAFVFDLWAQPDACVFLKNDVLDPLAAAADG